MFTSKHLSAAARNQANATPEQRAHLAAYGFTPEGNAANFRRLSAVLAASEAGVTDPEALRAVSRRARQEG